MASSNIRFGAGVTREVGMDLAEMRLRQKGDTHVIARKTLINRAFESQSGTELKMEVAPRSNNDKRLSIPHIPSQKRISPTSTV